MGLKGEKKKEEFLVVNLNVFSRQRAIIKLRPDGFITSVLPAVDRDVSCNLDPMQREFEVEVCW